MTCTFRETEGRGQGGNERPDSGRNLFETGRHMDPDPKGRVQSKKSWVYQARMLYWHG